MTEGAPRPTRPEDFVHFDVDLEDSRGRWRARKSPIGLSAVAHLFAFLLLAIPVTRNAIIGEPVKPAEILIRFYEMEAEGPGGGGGGGGSGGRRPTAYIRSRVELDPEKTEEGRKAPLAPRRIPPLRFDSLNVPDLPTETELLFGGVFSPDAVESPGLSMIEGKDYGGLDREPSSGTGGGLGGGGGTGVGPGEGWGVGPGRGGGFGGGDYRPASADVLPILRYEPPEPPYPPKAKEKSIRGQVVLEILVAVDGSTRVLRVLRSLPYCVETAIEYAELFRWKPALKNGKPVEHVGMIEITFELGVVRRG